MRAYMGYDNTLGPEEGAALIFANNCREAKKIVFPTIRSWFNTEWIDLRVRWLRVNNDYLIKKEADKKKFDQNIPHVIDSPEACTICLKWGEVITDGVCELCDEETYMV